MTTKNPIIEVKRLKNYFGEQWVHNGVDFAIYPHEIVAIIGASGCGKTTLLRSILMLAPFTEGTIKLFGQNIIHCSSRQVLAIQKRWGVLFQNNALFSSLTLLENVLFPLREYAKLPRKIADDVARLKIVMAGLKAEAGDKYPAELSGGMQKRGALARAIVMDPELLFLDEPTAGLDPNSAGDLDQLVLQLRKNLGLTIVIVTHDLDTLWTVTDRVIFLGEGKVLAAEPMHKLVEHKHPLIREYFSGPRAQYARSNQENKNGH